MKSQYRKNIIFLYVFSFFNGFIMAYVIERLFWAERGMSVNMVVSTEILYSIIVVLLEVPSGILADIFGRKRMMLGVGLLFSLFADRSIFYGFWSLGMICLVYGLINFIWIKVRT